jgi:hypothetical protein
MQKADQVLSVDDKIAREKSRLVALRIAILSLRSMENWRRPFTDYDSIVIVLAIAAISGEKLLRTTLEPEFQDLASPIPPDRLTPCNISSIAEASGLNRETTRRKVNRLLAAGLIQRSADGSISFTPGFSQRSEPIALVRAQLEILNRTANELVRDGVLKWSSRPESK